MGKTTIQLDESTKDRLDKRKHGDESYDTAVNRVLDDKGVLFTEDEIRSMVQSEIDRALRDGNSRY